MNLIIFQNNSTFFLIKNFIITIFIWIMGTTKLKESHFEPVFSGNLEFILTLKISLPIKNIVLEMTNKCNTLYFEEGKLFAKKIHLIS